LYEKANENALMSGTLPPIIMLRINCYIINRTDKVTMQQNLEISRL